MTTIHPAPSENATPPVGVSRSKGPWSHRVAFIAFTVILGVLSFWLIDFILSDVSDRPGPDRAAIEAELLDPALLAEAKDIDSKLVSNDRAIAQEQQRQKALRDSTAEAQRTMNQLLDFQRVAIDKGISPSADEQRALAESQRLFLGNQQRFESINQQVSQLEEARYDLIAQRRTIDTRRELADRPVEDEYRRQRDEIRWQVAAWEIALLLPLLVLAVFLWRRTRGTLYVYMSHAFAAAVGLHLAIAMHDCFPEEYFRYVLIGAGIFVVVKILVFLIRQVSRPKTNWLLRQYREAYIRFVCPVCEFPIRRGPLKFPSSSRPAANSTSPGMQITFEDGPYTCPHCAVRLYEECPVCQHQRHSLLPACEHCGATKAIEEIAAAATR